MAETPEQRRLRLQFRNAGQGFEAAPLPRPVVEEIPMQNQDLGRVDAESQLRRGQSGLPDPVQDSRTRIRTNEQFRGQPNQGDLFTDRPPQERMGLGERSQQALERAKRFTASPGTLTQGALQAQARPRAVGGVLAAGLGASQTAMNAANVYDQTGGDISETARQVAFDIPPAIGSTLGAVAGGVLGRRSPAVAATGMLAGGTLGDTGGRQIASGISRLAGGDGLSPLERAQQAQPPVDNTVFVSPANPDIPMPPELGGIAVDGRTGLPAQDAATATPAPVAAAPASATPAVAPAATAQAALTPEQQAASVAEGNGYGRTGIGDIVARTGDDGVPEFTNAPQAVAGARGDFREANIGNDRGTFSVLGEPGDSALAMQRFERANEIRREGQLADLQDRQRGEQRRIQQTMEINANRAASLRGSRNVRDRREANALLQQNESLGAQLQSSQNTEQAVGLGRENADVQRERNQTLGEGVRAQTALARQQLAQQREEAARTSAQTGSREDIAARNADTFTERVEGIFSARDPESGDVGVPPETLSLINERAPVYAEQREAALRQSITALRNRAGTDPAAAAQLQQAESDYARFVQDVYRVDDAGNPVELRPVREWGEDSAQPFFTDVRAQAQLQQDSEGTLLPELGGAAAGALAGFRRGGTPRGRIAGGVIGGVLGAVGGNQAENVALGQQTAVPQGAQNASPTIAANTNRVYTTRGNIVANLVDGSVVNLSDLIKDSSGRRTSANAPIIRAQFDALVAQMRSSDPQARSDAEQAMDVFTSNDDLFATLTQQQRAAIRRQGLGE